MQKREVLGNDTLHLVGNEYLIAVELYLILLQLEVVVNLGEIKNTRKIERIVDVHMYVEQRLIAHRIQLVVELFVLLLGNIQRLTSPQGLYIVDDVILVGIYILAIFPLLNLTKSNRYRQEVAILLQQVAYLLLLGVLLALLREVKNDRCSALTLLLKLLHLIFGEPSQVQCIEGASALYDCVKISTLSATINEE